jgi:hypothetical protein
MIKLERSRVTSGSAALLASFVLVLSAACQGATQSDVEGSTQAVQTRVTICHKGQTITVAEPAVAAHLRHGDTVGACGAGADAGTGADAGADAGVDAAVPPAQ